MKRKILPQFLAACALTTVACGGLSGQGLEASPAADTRLSLGLQVPVIAPETGQGLLSPRLRVIAGFNTSGRTTLWLGVPLGAAGGRGPGLPSLALGNAHATLSLRLTRATGMDLGLIVGSTIRLFGGEGRVAAIQIPPELDQPELWSDRLSAGVRGGVTHSRPFGVSGRTDIRLGWAALGYMGEGVELSTRFSARVTLPVKPLDLAAGFSTSHLTLGDQGIGSRLASYLELGATLRDRAGRPGLEVRVPLDREAPEHPCLSIGVRFSF